MEKHTAEDSFSRGVYMCTNDLEARIKEMVDEAYDNGNISSKALLTLIAERSIYWKDVADIT